MPNITINLTDAQWTRVQGALAETIEEERGPPTVRPATPEMVKKFLMRHLRARVLQQDLNGVAQAAERERRDVLAAEGW